MTGTVSGEIRMWDLTDYACLSVTKFPKSGAVLCLSLIDEDNILSGNVCRGVVVVKLLEML